MKLCQAKPSRDLEVFTSFSGHLLRGKPASLPAVRMPELPCCEEAHASHGRCWRERIMPGRAAALPAPAWTEKHRSPRGHPDLRKPHSGPDNRLHSTCGHRLPKAQTRRRDQHSCCALAGLLTQRIMKIIKRVWFVWLFFLSSVLSLGLACYLQ